MSELYKAIAGSPITYLAGDISAGQTTIAVADDTALPDAPNICTIGYGEHIETIRYGAKSNGVLQDVTRGIEGTPRAWQSGTEVARFYTAYDHNAIVNAIMSHKAETASKHISESGSNENGSYIKFDDGTQICWGKINLGSRTLNGSGSYANPYRTTSSSFPHPATFESVDLVGEPFVVFTPSLGGGGVSRGISVIIQRASSINMVSVQGISVSGGSDDYDVLVNFITIGRWKV